MLSAICTVPAVDNGAYNPVAGSRVLADSDVVLTCSGSGFTYNSIQTSTITCVAANFPASCRGKFRFE